MTCKSCQTDMLRCTAVTERLITADGVVKACKAYKPYYRKITIGLTHSIVISALFLFYVCLAGIFIGYELTWKTAEEQQQRDLTVLLREGLKGGRTFDLPGQNVKFHPRRDGGVNIKEGIK